jgi:DNA-binding MarR family transcriptional regulator
MATGTKAETLLQTLIDAVWVAHKLRAVGARTGAVNAAGGGTWGVLHTLVRQGPKTVPQIARMRPVARQHVQVLANELADQGLIEFRDNPAHKRSKLLVVTPAGKVHYETVKQRLIGLAEEMSSEIDGDEVAAASRLMMHVMAELDRRIEPGSE